MGHGYKTRSRGVAHSAFTAVVAALFVLIGWLQPFRPVMFVGDSMAPTYPHGSFAWSAPFEGDAMPGDIVVVRTESGPMVKRVAFIEGDLVTRFVRGLARIDAVGSNPKSDWVRAGWRDVPFRVPQGMVYLLGDNPFGSTDSRQLGLFREDQIERILINPRPFVGEHESAYASIPGGSGVL